MHPGKKRYALLATMTALLLTLPVLAWLQYRWITEAARADVDRRKAGLQRSAEQFTSEFNLELARFYVTVLGVPEVDDGSRRYYVSRINDWMSLAAHPRVISAVYLTEGGRGGADLVEYQPGVNDFVPVDWPSDLEWVRSQRVGLAIQSRDLPVIIAPRRPPHRQGPPPPAARDGGRRPNPPPREGPPPPDPLGLGPAGVPRQGPPRGWVLATLDVAYIRSEWVPELMRKHFADQACDIQILSRQSHQVIYDSNPSPEIGEFEHPDAEAALFESRPLPLGRGGPMASAGPLPTRWRLLVRDKAGPGTRVRDLAVSGAVFLLMGISLGVLLFAIRRADQLTTQQMQFVAAVSHELRTPLAVIRSAAENLADGIVTSGDAVKQYGNVIRDEGRRLSFLVEQTLRFAGIQTGRSRYNLVPVAMGPLLDDALRTCDATIRDAGCRVETNIEPDLPKVAADSSALEVAVCNLLTNAARHARDGGWIGLSAMCSNGRVRVEVRDRGPGIASRDLPHIFEPFYRGRKSMEQQVTGTGLGLALVRQIVTAHNGEVTVESREGGGTRFAVILPAAENGQATNSDR